ncbi:conserved protein, unknown function [Hepatocystis sp. ex Piliocolobus tephrosceles]|nr:conserved protein, unknown function [Hepatocystis sp. ex Piliocolobus tephrosceles]
MLKIYVSTLWSLLVLSFYDSFNLKRKINNYNNNIIRNINNEYYYNKPPINLLNIKSKFRNHFFVNNHHVLKKKQEKNNKNILFVNSNKDLNNQTTKLKIEKIENDKGTDFLYHKCYINNKEKKFIIDLCSNNSFIFKEDDNDGIDKIINNPLSHNNQLYLTYTNDDIKPLSKEIELNNKKIKIDKFINLKSSNNKNFNFFVTPHDVFSDSSKKSNGEMSIISQFDGILGFDFFEKFDNFLFDTIKMNILLNEKNNMDFFFSNIDNKKEDIYKIKLHKYDKNLKYVNVKIDGNIYKGIFDTGSSKTVLVNSTKFYSTEKNNKSSENLITIENILNDKIVVEKIPIKEIETSTMSDNLPLKKINLVSETNQLIPMHLDNLYKTNMEYLEKDIILIGLDFLLNKRILFDLKNGLLYFFKVGTSNVNNALDISYTNHVEHTDNKPPIDNKQIELKCKEIYEQLKKKELSFMQITNNLENNNIDIKDCKSTTDVIQRYAIMVLYGPDQLPKVNDSDSDNEYTTRYKEIINMYKKLNNEKKQNMLNNMMNKIKYEQNGNEIKASDVINKFIKYEIENKLYTLHKFKTENCNKKKEEAVHNEYNHLYNLYNSHPEYSFEILNDLKNELINRKINITNLKNEKDILKKVAELRVYNYIDPDSISTSMTKDNRGNNSNTNRKRKNIIIRRYSNDNNGMHTQIIIRGDGIDMGGQPYNNLSTNNSDNEQNITERSGDDGYSSYENLSNVDDIFPNSLFSNIFKNFFSDHTGRGGSSGWVERTGKTKDNSTEQRDEEESIEKDSDSDDEEGGLDFFSELNNLFGLGNIGSSSDFFRKRKKKKSVIGFKKTEKPIEKQNENSNDNLEEAMKEEKDVNIIYLLEKVKKLNDNNLKNFILQSLKNQNIRKILIDALKNGYNNTYDSCKKQNDNKSMYLLQMLKQSGVLS